ncbi:CRP FNR family transcriptional regulator [Limosilactobacillus vaginalis DSM 5837 = ATCC 49540]|jgi:CRP-like cAMP-binding protein|uniref:Cyclic nucleotide-binding domain protein n=2 Tax=Limosilactobacillus vaginalis TaxID=1633 RepID=C2EVH3_9LACO|nr:cyclic nucleotide-binding domain protein [Limosilactobacillus vaginalis DSM 5837 = ATCC 49540]KRM44446.1 CRP FNR family transcriptional regulator [Limosilactobacillus vaginalis DSM 5837 = ATCC 49540]
MNLMADLCVNLVPLFNALPQDEKMQIEKLVQHKNYQKGELAIEPMGSKNLVIVAQGSAKQYTLDEGGHENILQILHTGDYVGENWLFGQENINNYVETTEFSEICLLKRRDLVQLMHGQPELSIRLLELNMDKVSKMQTQIHLLTLPKVEDRLLEYLQAYADEIEKNSFALPLKMKDLALYLGTTPETLSRKFALLEKQGRLKRKVRQIKLFQN